MKAILLLALTLTLTSCFPLYVAEMMQQTIAARRAYAAYCQDHMQECIDAYNRAPKVYGSRGTCAGSSAGGTGSFACSSY